MVSFDGRTLLDSTSPLDNSTGTQFTVTYVGSSGPGGGGGHKGGRGAQSLTVPTNPVSLAPPTGQATVVVLYGVVPTDQAKKAGSGLAGSSQAS